MWISRGIIAAAIVLFLIFNILGPGDIPSKKEGNATIYYMPPFLPISIIMLGIIIGICSIVFFMQPGLFFKIVGIVLIVLSAFTLLNAPAIFFNRLVVTPDYLYDRTGSLFSPKITKIDFDSVSYITYAESGENKRKRPGYELQFFIKPDGELIRVPLNSLTKKALPEILDKAAQKDVVIDEDINILEE